MRARNFVIAASFAALIAGVITAAADYTVKDSTGATKTIFAFVCATTKICPASVPIDSTGADMTDTTNHVLFIDTRATGNLQTSLANGTATNGAAYPSVSVGVGGKDASGNIQPLNADPCNSVAKNYTPINIASATTTRIIAPTAAKKTYICSFDVVAQAAIKVGIVEGTGGTCGTGTAGVFGGTTAATGLDLPAEGSGAFKGAGNTAVWATAGTNVDFCLITSTAAQLSGHVTWVQK